MYRLRYLKDALFDIDRIYRYIRQEGGSPEVARHFTRLLRQKCEKLSNLPGHMGRPRPELLPEIRNFAFRNHVIFFRYVDEEIFEVVNILEGHRDIDSHFHEVD